VNIPSKPKSTPTVTEGTHQGELLSLIVEGVCCNYSEFTGFIDLSQDQVKRGLSNLKQKRLVYYNKSTRAWQPTRLGYRLYDEELA